MYNKVKLLHELCSLGWFIKKHALEEANKTGDTVMKQLLSELDTDIDSYIERFKKTLC